MNFNYRPIVVGGIELINMLDSIKNEFIKFITKNQI